MRLVRAVLRQLIFKTCSAGLQRKLRRLYVTKEVIKNHGCREREILALKVLICAGDLVADVGANVGVYTKELSSLVGDAGQVYSFEPVSENYAILEAVIRKVPLSNVHCFRFALGSRLSRREMVIPNLGEFTGYYWAHFARPGDSGQRETVDVLTLDDLWKKGTIEGLDFIKCDVEGSELEVVAGGLDLIQSHRPGWLLEVSRDASGKIFNILNDLGYRAFVYDDGLIETGSYRDKEFSNYLFLHPKSKVWSRGSQLGLPPAARP